MSTFNISVVVEVKGSDSVNIIADSTYEMCKYLDEVYSRTKKKFGDMHVTLKDRSTGEEASFTYTLTDTDREMNAYFRWDRMLKIIHKKMENLT